MTKNNFLEKIEQLSEISLTVKSDKQGLIQQKPVNKIESDLFSCSQLQDFLEISHTTRIKWTKTGILKSYRISNRVYYKKNEVLAALIPMEPRVD